MALEDLVSKLKMAISNATTKNNKKSYMGILAFEISGIMSKIVMIWKSLSDKQIFRLRQEITSMEGVRKLVSDDDSSLMFLACAEIFESILLLSKSISRLCNHCTDSSLQRFMKFFQEFSDSGYDSHNWVLSWREMEARVRRMDRFVATTTNLYAELNELTEMEQCLKKHAQNSDRESPIQLKKIVELQQKVFWQKQEVKYLKDSSLWARSFDSIAHLLVRSIFTILSRAKFVFGIDQNSASIQSSPPRCLSATVHPSETSSSSCKFLSDPSISKKKTDFDCDSGDECNGFLYSMLEVLKPMKYTLGASALALHYANLIIILEKMIKFPQSIGPDARDDLYSMLPFSVRSSLRSRLRGVLCSANDSNLAEDWREAMGRILQWLSPLAHNMIKWQGERSFERKNSTSRTNVLLLQTLYFANQVKTEAAITELLVGLNYIWRYEREMKRNGVLDSEISA